LVCYYLLSDVSVQSSISLLLSFSKHIHLIPVAYIAGSMRACVTAGWIFFLFALVAGPGFYLTRVGPRVFSFFRF
jgi:hypothetical protein